MRYNWTHNNRFSKEMLFFEFLTFCGNHTCTELPFEAKMLVKQTHIDLWPRMTNC